MINSQLTDYVKKAREMKQDDGRIKADLLVAGWSENMVNEALGIDGISMPSVVPVPSVPLQGVAVGSFFDTKTLETMKWAAIWWAVASVIMKVGEIIAGYFFASSVFFGQFGELGNFLDRSIGGAVRQSFFSSFRFSTFVNVILWGAVGGLISGIILAKFFPKIMELQKRFFFNKLNTLFKLLFIAPSAVILLESLLFGFFGFGWFIIYAIGVIAAYYLYAKSMVKHVGKYYPDFL